MIYRNDFQNYIVSDAEPTAFFLLGLVGASPLATTVSTEDSNMPLLALWGQICCRLAARPACVEQVRMNGFLDVQVQLGNWGLVF